MTKPSNRLTEMIHVPFLTMDAPCAFFCFILVSTIILHFYMIFLEMIVIMSSN
jgi:hypothetical protein